MFQLVEYRELKFNEKYKINDHSLEYTGRFKETCRLWSGSQCDFIRFDKLYSVTTKEVCELVFYNTAKFYAFVSQQPQSKMERRAVNLIVRRLIGDDCFEW